MIRLNAWTLRNFRVFLILVGLGLLHFSISLPTVQANPPITRTQLLEVISRKLPLMIPGLQLLSCSQVFHVQPSQTSLLIPKAELEVIAPSHFYSVLRSWRKSKVPEQKAFAKQFHRRLELIALIAKTHPHLVSANELMGFSGFSGFLGKAIRAAFQLQIPNNSYELPLFTTSMAKLKKDYGISKWHLTRHYSRLVKVDLTIETANSMANSLSTPILEPHETVHPFLTAAGFILEEMIPTLAQGQLRFRGRIHKRDLAKLEDIEWSSKSFLISVFKWNPSNHSTSYRSKGGIEVVMDSTDETETLQGNELLFTSADYP